ncbi:MAG: hypothetical protein LRZ84_14435 [Desertifilum sp.]|nr:hypothetical protein [Desertifilum sp.]
MLQERLQNPDEIFTTAEVYQAFEALAEKYGYYRDNRLPSRDVIQNTTSILIPEWEHLGAILIRPQTLNDAMLVIPSLVDKLLGTNLEPSRNTVFNASVIALAQTVIVSPPNLVEDILSSNDPRDLNFFIAFASEYKRWTDVQLEESKLKKFGKRSGNAPSSMSGNSTGSSQQTPGG